MHLSTCFFRHIFHDWPDSDCLSILRHTVSAMASSSRIVIADMVLPNVGASLFGSLLEVGMMTLVGMGWSAQSGVGGSFWVLSDFELWISEILLGRRMRVQASSKQFLQTNQCYIV